MKNLKLTAASKNLLLAIFKDLPNHDNSSPATNHTEAVLRGNLADLKKKKLVASFKDEGNEWLTLTDTGKKLAESLMEDPAPAKKTKKGAKPKAKAAANLKPSWLVARLRNALHKSDPTLKKDHTLKGVSTLSDIREALQKGTEEWEELLESFFNLGGRLDA